MMRSLSHFSFQVGNPSAMSGALRWPDCVQTKRRLQQVVLLFASFFTVSEKYVTTIYIHYVHDCADFSSAPSPFVVVVSPQL